MILQVNKDASIARSKNEFDKALEKIVDNANQGIDITIITFPKDIFMQCRALLNDYMKSHDVSYCWLDLGGGMVSLDYGTHRMMKFKLKQ